MARFLWICLGGAIGTGARYGLSGWVLARAGTAFPLGTLAVNVVGSFLITLIMHLSLATRLVSPTLRLFLTVGIMGGFTTYSTFNYETLRYAEDGAWMFAALNISATVVSCLAAGTAGLALARWATGA